MTPDGLIRVILVSPPVDLTHDSIVLAGAPRYEARGFSIRVIPDDSSITSLLAESLPHAIVTFGRGEMFAELENCPLEIRRRWIHLDENPEPAGLAQMITNVFVDVVTRDRFSDQPLVSVFTPTYNTGRRLMRAYRSLIAQTYSNWEWVILDDSPTEETFHSLREIAENDWRVRVYRSWRNSGSIGDLKRDLCGLAQGSILVELDHDDALTPDCLGSVVEALARFPDAGFAYTDCAEIFEDGSEHSYAPGWGLGFGSYRQEAYLSKEFAVTNYPPVNPKTIRHIVGVPNHVRAWMRSAYESSGGYGRGIHVADDYELLVRTFLTTRMVHIQRLGYVQFMSRSGGNTQMKRNLEIQRLVRLFRERYDRQIHERFLELGVEDWAWKGELSDYRVDPPSNPANVNYVLR